MLKAKNKYQQTLSQCSCDKKESTIEPKQAEIFEPCVVNLIQPLEESEMLPLEISHFLMRRELN